MSALEVAVNDEGSLEDVGRWLKLSHKAMKASLDVLPMRDQYFRYVTEQGVDTAIQKSFHVYQGHEAVFSESYRTIREALTSKLEI